MLLSSLMEGVLPVPNAASLIPIFLRANSVIILLTVPYQWALHHLGSLLRSESVIYALREGQSTVHNRTAALKEHNRKSNGASRLNWYSCNENGIILEDEEEQRMSTGKKMRGPIGVDEGLHCLEMS